MNTEMAKVTQKVRDEFKAAVIKGDEQGVRGAIECGVKKSMTVPSIITDIVGSSLKEVESQKLQPLQGGIVQQATETAFKHLSLLKRTVPSGFSAAVATLEPTGSVIWPRLTCDLLRTQGWDVTWLSAASSTGELLEWIEETKPNLIIFFIHEEASIDRLIRLTRRITALKIYPYSQPPTEKRGKTPQPQVAPAVMVSGECAHGHEAQLYEAGVKGFISSLSTLAVHARAVVMGSDEEDMVRGLIGYNLRLARERADMSQAELAALSGVDRTYILALEKGRFAASLPILYHILHGLRIQPMDLFPSPEQVDLSRRATQLEEERDPPPFSPPNRESRTGAPAFKVDDEEGIRIQLGLNLRAARKKANINQKGLSEITSIDRSYVVQIENGKYSIRVGRIYEIARALGVDPRDLLPNLDMS